MLTQFESYQLSHVINKFIGISKIPINTALAKIQGFQNTGISFVFVNTGSAL
jgi:hypothetical protein